MPFFRRQSEKAKKRLQKLQYLAREDPGPVFDVTECEITDLPQGVFSLCKVLNKEILLAHSNWLSALNGGGNLQDLANLRVLDLNNNELVVLPNDIGYLINLEVLNVSCNKLKELPSSIDHMTSLHTINAEKNKLKALPQSICNLNDLSTLDISSNFIHTLPTELCQIRALTTLTLDASHMSFPAPDVCAAGTESIMKYLCQAHGIQYISPSQMKREGSRKSINNRSEQLRNEMDTVTERRNSLRQYEQQKEQKRIDMLALEQQLEEDQRLQLAASSQAATNRHHLIKHMAKDQARLDGELSVIQQQRDSDKAKLISALHDVEKNTSTLVKQLLEISERARGHEELMEKMERERIEMEKWWEVHQEEMDHLRKKDVLVNMEKVLLDNAVMNQIIQSGLADRDLMARRTQHRAQYEDGLLHGLLDAKQADKDGMVRELLKEERLQKGAFEALQQQKDQQHRRIRGQIDVIEQELAQLTQLEVEQRNLKLNVQMNMLAEKRQTLMSMLMQLMEERDKRETVLKDRMHEMELHAEDRQSDYWLVQYQRLMDRKPQTMLNMEKQLEFSVLEILEDAKAVEYTSLFARHRITIETLLQLTDDELKQMGIHEMGLRKNVLRSCNKYQLKKVEERAAAKAKGLEYQEDEWIVKPPAPNVQPNAPGASTSQGPVPSAPPAPPNPELTAHFTTECVVCMEFTSSVLFLQQQM